jgi:hypothetical protein
MINITATWDIQANQYRQPWHVILSAQDWRTEDRGEVVALCLPDFPTDKSPNEVNSFVPQCAALPRTFIDATTPKEIEAVLKFGRDSYWPLRITIDSSLDGLDSSSRT